MLGAHEGHPWWGSPGPLLPSLLCLCCCIEKSAVRLSALLGASVLCLDCVRLPGLWFTFFHEFGKFSATAFPNRLSSSFFMSSWNSDLYLIALPTRSCLSFLVFSLSLQTKVSPWLCISFHFLQSLKCVHCLLSTITGVILQFLKPLFIFFPQDCLVWFCLFLFSGHIFEFCLYLKHIWQWKSVRMSSIYRVCIGLLLRSCWWLLISFVGLIYASFWNTVQKFF